MADKVATGHYFSFDFGTWRKVGDNRTERFPERGRHDGSISEADKLKLAGIIDDFRLGNEPEGFTPEGFRCSIRRVLEKRAEQYPATGEYYLGERAEFAEMLDSSTTPALERPPFQRRVSPWMQECFGPSISADYVERNHRFIEEALELVQANGCTAIEAHQLVDYVFSRPEGVAHQEVGGVMVTLAALCLARGLDMHEAGDDELRRVWANIDKIRAKQAAKPKHSPLPETISVRYIGHPIIWPRSTWRRRSWCNWFGHDWVKTNENSEADPRCYECGARMQAGK